MNNLNSTYREGMLADFKAAKNPAAVAKAAKVLAEIADELKNSNPTFAAAAPIRRQVAEELASELAEIK